MNPFGKGFILGGLCTAFMLAMKGWLIVAVVIGIAVFMTWLPDKYIWPKGTRYNP